MIPIDHGIYIAMSVGSSKLLLSSNGLHHSVHNRSRSTDDVGSDDGEYIAMSWLPTLEKQE